VIVAVGVDEESGNLLLEVNVSGLRAGRSRDSDYFPDAAVDVVNVGNERSAAVCRLAIVAGHLRQVVAAEQLLERSSRKIDRLEGVVVVDETVSDACLVDIEAARPTQPVDADDPMT
jgi:hypothetical protein